MTTRPRQYRLSYLAALTALALACIVALQVYWLYTSYTQQRTRFKSDIGSIVTEVAVYQSMVNAYNSAQKLDAGAGSSIVINFTNSGKKARKTPPFKVTVSDGPSATPDGFYVYPAEHSIPAVISAGRLDTLMDSCRAQLAKELKQREIRAPYEVALIGEKGGIVRATCDTARFNHSAYISPAKALISEKEHPRLSLKVAFPDANSYLLRRMAMILAVTILLIVIGAWSFSYMLVHFFRQKKIADIRNDFMNNMTHELKTPISGALVALELAGGKRHAVDEVAKQEYITTARGELNRLTLLIDKVLRMAAFDHGQMAMNKTNVPIATLINEAVANLRTFIDTAGAVVQVAEAAPGIEVYADRMHLVNVFQNLIENAIKYNDKPQAQVNIGTAISDAGITITVADNGRGIPAAYVAKVFDKFFRVPMGDVHDVKGYGLGLSYVKAIVALHGGTVTVTSKEGAGSTFRVLLPNH